MIKYTVQAAVTHTAEFTFLGPEGVPPKHIFELAFAEYLENGDRADWDKTDFRLLRCDKEKTVAAL